MRDNLDSEPKVTVEQVGYSYDGKPVLRDITLGVPRNAVTAFLGPAGGGKTTLLRLINRLND
ncbi:MAG TPA: ATP-binding cassette domain-containing protein, partial [Anaerolineae bacterium]